MDLYGAIAELLNEKKRLDRLISSLEAMQNGVAGPALGEAPKRRGRKHMSEDERREVSERMKRYWASRRDGGTDPDVSTPAT
jgi:hypothetical protein